MTDEDVPDIPILPSQEDVTPPTLVTNETAAQTFIRILGYVDISEEFIDTILAPLRIRTFRMAMILDESQLNKITELANASGDPGMQTDSLQFFSLLNAGSYYVQQANVRFVPWATLDEDAIFDMITDFRMMNKVKVEEIERIRIEAANQSNNADDFVLGRESFPTNNDTFGELMGGASGAGFAKKTLKPFENCKFPAVPVTVKDMQAFKINMKNQMRSMDLDHLLKESYVPPEVGEAGHEKFRVDNKFFYLAVVKIMTNPNHPARNWLMTKENENDGRSAYFKLVNHYDNETTIEDSHGIVTAYIRWANTKLTGVHLGAMKAYITKYQTVLSDAKEAGGAIPDNPAKDMFLAHIKPDAYQQVTMNCRIDKLSLSKCMERCLRAAVTVEANAASRTRRAARATNEEGSNGTTLTTTSTGNVTGGRRPKTYKGKDIDEYGFFKDRSYWGKMTTEQKSAYFKQQDKWVKDGLILKKSKGGGSNNLKALIEEVVTDMIGAIDTGSDSPPTDQHRLRILVHLSKALTIA